MLRLAGKPILEHILNDLPGVVDHVILVVGYLHQQIHDYFGHRYQGRKIDYIIQPQKLGTYHALELCKDRIIDGEKFIVTYADDIHNAENYKKFSESERCALLTLEAEDPKRFGVVEVDGNGRALGIEEKPENPKSNLVSIGVLVLDNNVFNYPAKQHSNGEYYLTDSVAQMIKDGHEFRVIRSNFWLPIGFPGDLENAEKIIKNST